MENFLPVILSVVGILSILGAFFVSLCLNLSRRAKVETEAMIAGIFKEARLELGEKLNGLKSDIKAVDDEAAASHQSGVSIG